MNDTRLITHALEMTGESLPEFVGNAVRMRVDAMTSHGELSGFEDRGRCVWCDTLNTPIIDAFVEVAVDVYDDGESDTYTTGHIVVKACEPCVPRISASGQNAELIYE